MPLGSHDTNYVSWDFGPSLRLSSKTVGRNSPRHKLRAVATRFVWDGSNFWLIYSDATNKWKWKGCLVP